DEGAVLHARRHFLADEAALFEIDAAELLEAALKQERLFDRHVGTALGNTEGEAQAAMLGERAGRKAEALEGRSSAGARQDGAAAEGRKARIDECHAALECPRHPALAFELKGLGRILSPQQRHRELFARIRDRDLGAQLVHRQPALEVIEPAGLAVENKRAAMPAFRHLGNEEIVEEAALRVEQGRVDGAVSLHLVEIVGEQPLEEGARLLASDDEASPLLVYRIVTRGHGPSLGEPRL